MRANQSIKVGDVFKTNSGGDVVVLEYKTYRRITVQFLDEYGHQKTVYGDSLKFGRVKNPYAKTVVGVACIGAGRYSSGAHQKLYGRWKKIIERCYDPYRINKDITYKDVYVCDEWLNFQNFAEWYLSQPNCNFDFDLDKDLLGSGSKIYSPSTCTLLPPAINAFITTSTGRLSFSKTKCGKSYRVGLVDEKGRQKKITLKTKDEVIAAHSKSKQLKKELLLSIWGDKLTDRAYKALKNI